MFIAFHHPQQQRHQHPQFWFSFSLAFLCSYFMGMFSTHFLSTACAARTRSQVFDKQQWFLSSQNNEPTHLFHHVPLLSSGNPTLAKASAENGPPTANSGAEATKATWKQTKKQNQRSDRRKIPIISTAAHTTSQALEWFFPLSCYSSKHLQVIACVVELFFRWCWNSRKTQL